MRTLSKIIRSTCPAPLLLLAYQGAEINLGGRERAPLQVLEPTRCRYSRRRHTPPSVLHTGPSVLHAGQAQGIQINSGGATKKDLNGDVGSSRRSSNNFFDVSMTTRKSELDKVPRNSDDVMRGGVGSVFLQRLPYCVSVERTWLR